MLGHPCWHRQTAVPIGFSGTAVSFLLLEQFKFIPLRPRLVDKIPKHLGIGFRFCMEQVERPGMQAVYHFLQAFRRVGLVFHIVVQICEAPEYRFVIQVIQEGKGLFIELPGWVAEQVHFIAELVLDVIVEPGDFVCLFLNRLGVQAAGRVGDAVVAHFVPFVNHPLHQVIVLVGKGFCHEKYSRHLFFLQGIQNPRGAAIFIPLVNG